MLNKLDLRPGQELTREGIVKYHDDKQSFNNHDLTTIEIIAKLPNAPDGHITFISQLIADRDALEEVDIRND